MNLKDIKFPDNSKFLVTGGAGFIGSNLCETLIKMGYKVRCLDNLSTGKKENIENLLSNENFEFIEGDICNLDTCMKSCLEIDYVFHEAAWGSVPKSINMPLIYEEINIRGTLNMLEAARENKVKRFVYATSSSVYGDNESEEKQEEIVGNVLSPYALTKKTCEEYARLYTKLYGLETIGLRYFNVFGRRQDPYSNYAAVIPNFVKLLLKGESPTIYGNGEQSRDFTYIDNVIFANFKSILAPKEASGEIYNIGCGASINLNYLYSKICEILKIDLNPIYAPKRVGDILNSKADISKAKKFLNYDVLFNFDEGLLLTINWYKDNLK